MATREAFIAALPSKSMRKTAAALDAALAGRAELAMNCDELAELVRISRAAVPRTIRALKAVGLIQIGSGPHRVSVLSKAETWSDLGPNDVMQLLAQAKQPGPRRVRQLASPSKPLRKPVAAEPEEAEPEPRYAQPSLPKLRFMGEL